MEVKNIFVVDDDKIFHFLVKKLLNTNGINVNPSFFENGHEAIHKIKDVLNCTESLPDLILLDINMPVLDGCQFLEEFRQLKESLAKQIKICIISSSDNGMDKDMADVYKNEISNYYLKPITRECIKTIFNITS